MRMKLESWDVGKRELGSVRWRKYLENTSLFIPHLYPRHVCYGTMTAVVECESLAKCWGDRVRYVIEYMLGR